MVVALLVAVGWTDPVQAQTSGTKWEDAIGGRYLLEANNKVKVRGAASTNAVVAIRNQATAQGSLLANILALENKDGVVYFKVDSAGATTSRGLETMDSAAIAGVVKIGGATSNGTSTLYLKGLSARLYIARFYSSSGTEKASIDTVGKATVVGLVTTGAITATSQTIASGAVTSTGLSSFQRSDFGIGQNSALNVLTINAFDGTDVATIDSVGKATVVGLVTTGAITATSQTIASGAITSTGLSSFQRADFGVGQNAALSVLTVNSFDGTDKFVVDSTGATTISGLTTLSGLLEVTSSIARIDSFLTDGVTDTLSWTGATVGDVFTVTPYLPAHSSVADTGSSPYAFEVVSAGIVVVHRTKLTAGSTLKSAAIYAIRRDGL